MIAFLVLNFASLLAVLFVLDRMGRRQHEERREHREEIAVLLQRIQAPEVAVQQHASQDSPPPLVGVPLTDDALAEQMQQIGELERRLNAQVNGHFQLEDEIT